MPSQIIFMCKLAFLNLKLLPHSGVTYLVNFDFTLFPSFFISSRLRI